MSEINYDSYVKEFIGACSEKNVIKFINTLFGEDFPLDSTVTRLETETVSEGEVRRSDFMIKINERLFTIEVQSTHDSSIILRMVEYSFRGAYMHGKRIMTEDRLVLDFPDPVVFYLRNTDKTPTELTVELNFTGKDSFSYKIPVKRLGDYTRESLIDGSLYPISPFYPMNFEKTLFKQHTSEDESRFIAEINSLYEAVEEKHRDGELNNVESRLIYGIVMKITENIISKTQITNEEVNVFMEKAHKKYESDILNAMDEGEQKGIQKGEQKTKIETARKMKRDNLPFDAIRKYTDLPVETIQAL